VRSAELAGADRTTPTHVLTAEFYALTHADRLARSDAYVCAFQLMEMQSEQIIWEDRYEVKYQVERSRLD
jgi:hypothetical protein